MHAISPWIHLSVQVPECPMMKENAKAPPELDPHAFHGPILPEDKARSAALHEVWIFCTLCAFDWRIQCTHADCHHSTASSIAAALGVSGSQ